MNPRQYSLCVFDCLEQYWNEYPFSKHDKFIFLGEIPNLKGHCVVANFKTGQIYSGYHTDNFIEHTD